jgi:hypothetical protein
MTNDEIEFLNALKRVGFSRSICESICEIRKAIFEGEEEKIILIPREDAKDYEFSRNCGFEFAGELKKRFGDARCSIIKGEIPSTSDVPTEGYTIPVTVLGCDVPCTLYYYWSNYPIDYEHKVIIMDTDTDMIKRIEFEKEN